MSTIIVTSAQPGDGKSTVAAALALHLLQSGRKVHVLRIRGDDAASAERDAALLAAIPGVRSPGKALLLPEAEAAVKKAGRAASVFVEADAAEAKEAASAWGARVVVVGRAQAPDIAAVLGGDVSKAAVAVTAVPAKDISKVRAALEAKGSTPFLLLPEDRTLAAPRLSELAQALEASFLCDGADQNDIVECIMIGSVSHDPGAPYFSVHERKAALTRFEKTDVQLAALGTPLVCLLLTGGQQPSPYLFDRAQSVGVPVLLTARTTVEAMEAAGEAYAVARFDGEQKLERLSELAAEHLDAAVLETLLS
jgi:BioD-like phosphotransacetylase family protein